MATAWTGVERQKQPEVGWAGSLSFPAVLHEARPQRSYAGAFEEHTSKLGRNETCILGTAQLENRCIQCHPRATGSFSEEWRNTRKDFELVCFGDYTRRASGDNERVQTVQLVRHGGDERALYLRIDSQCPGLFANDPAFSEDTKDIPSNGVILEFQERDYGDPARVCIVIGKTITAEEEDREIWVTYNLAHVKDRTGSKRQVGRTSTSRPLTRSQTTNAVSVGGKDVSAALQGDDDAYEEKQSDGDGDDDDEED